MEPINLEFFFNLEREGQKSVIDFCIKMGFIASSYECPECQKPMKLTWNSDRGSNGFVWYCKHKRAHRRSVRSGSWFQESRLSLIMMLKLAYLWVKKTAHDWIADELKLSKNSVTDWMAFFRRVCVNAIMKEGIFIGGPNEIVEIDAKSFSSIKNKQGCETWVLGGVERGTKRCFLEILHTGEEDEIISILQKYVHPGTTIISDNWKGFDSLESNGYVHSKFNKTSRFKDSATGVHKNNILCLWGRLKKVINKRIAKDQFDAHLAEFMWRSSHQGETQELLTSFFKILSQMSTPRVRDDPTYISKRAEIGKEKTEDCVKSVSDMEFSENELIGETFLNEDNTDNYEKETFLNEDNTDNYEKETQPVEVEEDDCRRGNVSAMNFSENELVEDEFEGENGSQNKEQRTLENLDT